MIVPMAFCPVCGGSTRADDLETYPSTWPTYRESAEGPELHFCSQACLILELGADRQSARKDRLGIVDTDIRMLQLLALGHTNAQIGRALLLSESTVKNRLTHTYLVLGVTDRLQAVLVAHARGLINLSQLAQQFLEDIRQKKPAHPELLAG